MSHPIQLRRRARQRAKRRRAERWRQHAIAQQAIEDSRSVRQFPKLWVPPEMTAAEALNIGGRPTEITGPRSQWLAHGGEPERFVRGEIVTVLRCPRP